MSDPKPELSSIASALAELTSRIAALGEDLSRNNANDIAHELFEVERHLAAGQRRLEGLVAKR